MIRKFAVALFAVSSLSSSIAMALGLGEAKVNSALNQPLDAEIELVSVRDLEASEIFPSLAGTDQFLRAGIERHHFLGDLKFQVQFKGADKAVIKVTSNKPVREPFLNFLVEVVWPNGRLLREYALLIDPPMFANEAAAPVQPAAVTATATPAPRPAPVARQAISGTSAGANVYGPTSSSDTLWKIASRHRPATHVTTQQTMLAIRDLNPDAFIDGNINKLKAGHVLRLPDLEDVQRRTPEQALAEVRLQNRSTAERQAPRERGLDATGAKQQRSQVAATQSGDELRILVDRKEEGAGSGDLAGGRGAAGGSGVGQLEPQVAIALERLDKAERDNQELRDRLKELESQLDSLHRLVALKDDQLAVLQGQVTRGAQLTEEIQARQPDQDSAGGLVKAVEERGDSGVAPAAAVTTAASVAVDTPAEHQPASEQTPAKRAAAPESVPAAEPGFMEQVLSSPLYQAIGLGALVLILAVLWLISRQKAREEQDFQQRLAKVEPNDGDDVLDLDVEPATQAPSVAAAATAGLAGFQAQYGDTEEGDVLVDAEGYLAYGRVDQAIRLLEDGLAEAPERLDLRMKLLEAYVQARNAAGFEQQLAEVRASGDEEALARAEELRLELMASGSLDDMEPELSLDDLEQQLRQGGVQAPEAQATEAEEENLFEFDALDDHETEARGVAEAESDIGDWSSETSLASADDELNNDNLDIEFDVSELDLDTLDSPSAEAAVSEPDPDALPPIDYETPSLADESPAAEEEWTDSEVARLQQELESLDLSAEPKGETGLDETLDQMEAQEFGDLDLTGEVAEDETTLESGLLETESAAELDEFETTTLADEELQVAAGVDSALELDEPALRDEPVASEETLSDEDLTQIASPEALMEGDSELDEDDFDFLSGTDEVATKLDLARAYIDMGDHEGARDILQEVAQEGNDQQRQEAEDMLKGLE